jgi:hypothetical protein
MLRKKDCYIEELKSKVSRMMKVSGRISKKQVRIIHNWNGEETNFADVVAQFCKYWLFPMYKFLKPGWEEYQPSEPNSLSSLVEQKLIKHILMGLNRQELWDRVTAHSIRNKYMNMKCNINNAIKVAYKGEFTDYNVSFV